MKKVLDENGHVINGLLRDHNGALVVSDKATLEKYNKILKKETEMKSLREEVTELKEIVKSLQNMIINTNNILR